MKQDNCPKCDSDNIANEDAPQNGLLQLTCHDCSHQWDVKYKTHKYVLTIEFESELAVVKGKDALVQFENGLTYFVEVPNGPESINNTFVYGTGKTKLKKVS